MVVARGVDEESELVVWVRAIAVAVLAGVIAKLTLFPPGALAGVPVAVRVGAVAIGLCGFLLARRSVFAGVAAGEVALFAGMLFWPSDRGASSGRRGRRRGGLLHPELIHAPNTAGFSLPTTCQLIEVGHGSSSGNRLAYSP